MIGSARECEGLYILEEGMHLNKEGQESSCLQIFNNSSNKEIYLLHFRLGHPSFHYMNKLFPDLYFPIKIPLLFNVKYVL